MNRTVHADLGRRLRRERQRRRVGLRELARRVGVSASLISQIETGKSKASVSTLYAIVNELGISLDGLFADGSAPAAGRRGGPVQRGGDRKAIHLESGVLWERLTPAPDPEVDFLYDVYDVGGASSQDGVLMRHAGREYGFVLRGRLGVTLGFEDYELGPGDSICFESTTPHRLWNAGDEPVHAVWFVVGRHGGAGLPRRGAEGPPAGRGAEGPPAGRGAEGPDGREAGSARPSEAPTARR